MNRDKLQVIERKIEQIARAVNEHQSRLDLLQNAVFRSQEVEQLSVAAPYHDVMKENLNTGRIQMPESLKLVTKELIKEDGKWLTATEIAQRTKRSRNLISGYLQRLFEKGYLVRQRNGRNVHYAICSETYQILLEG